MHGSPKVASRLLTMQARRIRRPMIPRLPTASTLLPALVDLAKLVPGVQTTMLFALVDLERLVSGV